MTGFVTSRFEANLIFLIKNKDLDQLGELNLKISFFTLADFNSLNYVLQVI